MIEEGLVVHLDRPIDEVRSIDEVRVEHPLRVLDHGARDRVAELKGLQMRTSHVRVRTSRAACPPSTLVDRPFHVRVDVSFDRLALDDPDPAVVARVAESSQRRAGAGQ